MKLMTRASRTFDIKHLTFDKIKSSVKCQVSSVKVKRGFTLIELLIVITIIAILIAAVSASFINAQQKGRDGKRKADLKAVQQALELYFQTYGHYPVTWLYGRIACEGANVINWGEPFICDNITFMQQLPQDPVYFGYGQGGSNKMGYSYMRDDMTNPTDPTSIYRYTISATLENTNDPDLANLSVCSVYGANRNYCVTNP